MTAPANAATIHRWTWKEWTSTATKSTVSDRWKGYEAAGQPKHELKTGWTEGVKLLDMLPAVELPPQARTRVRDWNQGDTWDQRRAEDGLSPWTRRVRKTNPTQTIIVNLSESCGITAAQMIYKAYAAARIADQLESAGTACEIITAEAGQGTYQGRPGEISVSIVTIKQPEDPINLALIATACSPWSLRDWAFARMEATGPVVSGYGQPTPIAPHLDLITPDPHPIIIDVGQCLSLASAEQKIKDLAKGENTDENQ